MTTPDTDTLAWLLAEATPGPWVTSETTIHGVKYGGMWVQGADQPDDDGLMKPPLICISGSGGSRSYTTRIVERQDHDDNDANARLIALAPELAEEVIALRAQAAKDKARIERLEARLAAAEAGEDALAEALRSYRADLCEGFCLEAEWSDEAHNHPAMQRDCGGCLAAAALAAYEARRKG